jgi:hypothetical protein
MLLLSYPFEPWTRSIEDWSVDERKATEEVVSASASEKLLEVGFEPTIRRGGLTAEARRKWLLR